MFKTHYGETVTVVLALVIGFLMAIASVFIDHLSFNFSNVFKIWAMITLVVLLVSIFVPYKEWSSKLLKTLGVKTGGIGYKLADNVLPSLILNTCNTVFVSAANILYNETIPPQEQMSAWRSGMLHDWPIMFVVSYFAAFLAEAAGKRVADKYVKM